MTKYLRFQLDMVPSPFFTPHPSKHTSRVAQATAPTSNCHKREGECSKEREKKRERERERERAAKEFQQRERESRKERERESSKERERDREKIRKEREREYVCLHCDHTII